MRADVTIQHSPHSDEVPKFYDRIEWLGVELERTDRLARIKAAIRDAHLARHNNDFELRRIIVEEGFDAFYARLVEVRDMFAA